ncbi:MAG: PaaI family thioesterase [Vicinamibacterales bacterium]
MTSPPQDFTDVPVNRFLGFEMTRRDEKSAVISMRPDRLHAQEYGVIHGGILSTLADTAAVYTIQPLLASTDRLTSIEFKINFLAAAVPEGRAIVASAELVRRGKRVAVARVDVHQGETHVATGLFTYLIAG